MTESRYKSIIRFLKIIFIVSLEITMVVLIYRLLF